MSGIKGIHWGNWLKLLEEKEFLYDLPSVRGA